jgi:transcriptional regulator with GAF, ATPase, and Fis domain
MKERKIEILIIKFSSIYIILLIAPSIFKALFKLKSNKLPRILKQQLSTFIFLFLIPKLILEQLQNSFWTSNLFDLVPSNLGPASLNIILSTYFLYFCITKLLGLRFLNAQDHVQLPRQERSIFASYMKKLMPQILVTEQQEHLHLLTQQAFQQLFKVNPEAVMLWVDSTCFAYEHFVPNLTYLKNKKLLEGFNVQYHPTESIFGAFLYEERIAIRDEIEFSHYCNPDEKYEKTLLIMEELNADIIIPIYENHTLLAALIVTHNARQSLYNDVERDEMISFAHYIASALITFKYKRFENIAAQNKMLREVAHYHQQEAQHYQEGLALLHRERVERTIGMVHYNEKKLIPCTPTTSEILHYDFTSEHHPTYDILTKIAHAVEQYHQSYEHIYQVMSKKEVRLIGIPLGSKASIIAVIPLDAIERVKAIENLIQNPSDREYLFFLEATHIGKIINELIPGRDVLLMQFKIALLKVIMSKKQCLVQLAEQDIHPFVTFIHQASKRNALQFLTLTEREKNNEVALKIFGSHHSFNSSDNSGLLEQLKDEGTLCIENIHLLSLETQKKLSHFLRIGYFTPLRSSHLISSTVRIIATTAYNIHDLVAQGIFYGELAELLTNSVLTLSSLMSTHPQEYSQLLEGYASQALKSKGLAFFVRLTEEDKQLIQEKHPASFQEIKELVHRILVHKTNQKKIEHLIEFDPAASLTDPDLIQAQQLGKHALKNEQLMLLLWQKFNNQSHIAQLLGVNRSTVHRRLKELQLTH